MAKGCITHRKSEDILTVNEFDRQNLQRQSRIIPYDILKRQKLNVREIDEDLVPMRIYK